ncbi:MAG: hypothetical protein JOY79_04290 [Acidobacteriaceae bacterium]|nr:hypothetical protein [Acidobacteriaceae bacterium]
MKVLFWVGLVVLILGIVSLVVPLPHSESHGLKAGDVSVGVTTHSKEKVAPVISGVLIVGGILMMIGGGAGRRG